MAAAHDGCFNYQVFSSYRWKDTGNTFTGFLHSSLKRENIDAFLDSEDLRRGEEMLPNLFQTIQSSKILIPVISKGYADSRWCLEELAEMVKCYTPGGQILILPIFFDVEPGDVKNHTGIIKESFDNKHTQENEETRQTWKNALTVVAGMRGHELKEVNGNQSKLVTIVVEWVLRQLSSNYMADVKHPVGLGVPVKEIEARLDFLSSDVELVGICGSWGIGKTTIAKAFYKDNVEKFGRSCFLFDIGETKDIQILQKKLIEGISKREVGNIPDRHTGKLRILQRLSGSKVLLILDNVDDRSQLDAFVINHNWLAPGSKVIITSRRNHILKLAKIVEDKIYRHRELDNSQSLELLSLHAFSKHPPPEDYRRICLDMLQLAKGLPLTLIELGSFLSAERDMQVWQVVLRRLQGLSHSQILEELKICYKEKDDASPTKKRKKILHISFDDEVIIST